MCFKDANDNPRYRMPQRCTDMSNNFITRSWIRLADSDKIPVVLNVTDQHFWGHRLQNQLKEHWYSKICPENALKMMATSAMLSHRSSVMKALPEQVHSTKKLHLQKTTLVTIFRWSQLLTKQIFFLASNNYTFCWKTIKVLIAFRPMNLYGQELRISWYNGPSSPSSRLLIQRFWQHPMHMNLFDLIVKSSKDRKQSEEYITVHIYTRSTEFKRSQNKQNGSKLTHRNNGKELTEDKLWIYK